MLKRPTSRRKSHSENIEINLVPILDTMVTLIGFLLFTTSFVSMVSIESQLPQSSSAENAEPLKEKPLQLTLTLKPQEVEIWSPFSKITAQSIKNKDPGQLDTQAIHDSLLEIKRKFPYETTLVIVPARETAYDSLIAVMDSVRLLAPTDAPIYLKNEKTGIDETVKTLFPQVVFGNLLGDT